jgi:hypothetical protein
VKDEEIAAKVVLQIASKCGNDMLLSAPVYDGVREAIALTREDCAKIAEEWADTRGTSEAIAAAIRERGK